MERGHLRTVTLVSPPRRFRGGRSDTIVDRGLSRVQTVPFRPSSTVVLVVILAASVGCDFSGPPSSAPISSPSYVPIPTQLPSPTQASPSAPQERTSSPVASPVEHSLTYPGLILGEDVSIRVLDFSFGLIDVREATREEMQLMQLAPDTIAVATLPSDPNSLFARWTASVCEGPQEVFISSDAHILEVRQPPREQCDATGSYVTIVLTFHWPIDGNQVFARLVEGTIAPE